MSKELITFLKNNFGELSEKELLDIYIENQISKDIFIIAIVSILMGLFIMLICIIVDKSRDSNHIIHLEEVSIVLIVISAICILACFIILCFNIVHIINCKTFPQKVLYDDISLHESLKEK